jgi:hypothetical protein
MPEIDHQRARSSEVDSGKDVPTFRGRGEIRFESKSRQQVYRRVERLLLQQEYVQHGKSARGVMRRCIGNMPGFAGRTVRG